MTESQRTMIAAELAKLKRGGDAGVHAGESNAPIGALVLSQDQAADMMKVSRWLRCRQCRGISMRDPRALVDRCTGCRSINVERIARIQNLARIEARAVAP